MKEINKENLKFKIREDTLDEYILNEQKQYFDKITLTNQDIWLDAGANLGFFSILISAKVKKVIAYEPEEENFNILNQNLNLNNIKNVNSVKKVIVGDNTAIKSFFVNTKKNKGTHSLMVKRGRIEKKCVCSNINTIISNNNINKIKLDVEGAEYEIIRAITKDNWGLIKEIILEFHFNMLKDHPHHYKYLKIIEILRANFKEVIFNKEIKKHWTTLIYAKN